MLDPESRRVTKSHGLLDAGLPAFAACAPEGIMTRRDADNDEERRIQCY